MKIAAYCRVSTSKEEQLDSLAHQKEFFQSYADLHGEELVGIYADEGISGTRLQRREQFQALMRDAGKGRFEVVVVKDISRFARNTVDFLQSVRKLKELGVNTRFLTANMDSLGESEFVLTLFGALAQEESANLSKRVKFGKKLNAQKGRVPQRIYGYDRQDNFTLRINPGEADVVRIIYDWYLAQGLGCRSIAQRLNHGGYVTKLGCSWTPSAVHRILTNPIYCGHYINHKYEVENYLTGKQKKIPPEAQFHHDRPQWAIVTPQQFQQVQKQRQERGNTQEQARYSARHRFSGLMICQECGKSFCRKTYTYAKTRIYWKCSGNDQGTCGNRIKIEEEQLMDAITDYVEQRMVHRDNIAKELQAYLSCRQTRTRTPVEERQRLERKMERYAELYANEAITLDEYMAKKGKIVERVSALQQLEQKEMGENRWEKQVARYMKWEGWTRADMAKLVERITVNGEGEVTVFLRSAEAYLPV